MIPEAPRRRVLIADDDDDVLRKLRDAPEGPFSTNLFWDRAIAAGRAFGVVHQGLWFDVGTPQAIPVVEADLLHG